MLDLTAFFIYFHHLTEDIRSQFQWVTFGRLKSVSVLKIDQNCLDNQFINTISEVWPHSLTDFHIEVHDSYRPVSKKTQFWKRQKFFWTHWRNIRFANLLFHRSDPLSWDKFNLSCQNCRVHFVFGGRKGFLFYLPFASS